MSDGSVSAIKSRKGVKKPDWLRLAELEQSLLVVRDAVEALDAGRGHQSLALAAQLRALLVEKRRKNPPLLLAIADELRVQLTLFIGPPISADPSREEMLIDLGGMPVTANRLAADQQEIPLAEVLDHRVLRVRGDTYSIGQLIKIGAEKAGGAHHPEVVPEDVARLLTFRQLGIQPLKMVLVAVGRAVLRLGFGVLRSLCDLDMHLVAVFPSNRSAVLCVFDAYDPETEARIVVLLDPLGRITLSVVSVDGTGWTVLSEALVSAEMRIHLCVSIRLTASMHTEVSMSIAGRPAGRFSFTKPSVLSGFLQDYVYMFNGARDNTLLSGGFALASIQFGPAGEDLATDAAVFAENAAPSAPSSERYLMIPPGLNLSFGTKANRGTSGEQSSPTGEETPPYDLSFEQVVSLYRAS